MPGIACGVVAALFWAIGLVAARHGANIGMSPLIISMHRFLWSGIALLPFVLADGFADLGGVGWGRGIVLTLLAGLPLSMLSYVGLMLVPLGHAAVIQPSCAALGGLVLASAVLKEALPFRRIAGALAIVLGLAVIGNEAIHTMGVHGLGGDFLFVLAGSFFATFGMLLRLWQIAPTRAAFVTTVLSLAGVPLLLIRFDNFVAAGFWENLLQAVVQGGLTGAAATYLFAKTVVLLGAGRAMLFPALVPPFTLLTGYIALGEVPSIAQLVGLVIVVIGFRLTQMG